MRRILCLHMPDLPIERARRDAASADEQGRPLVLTRAAGASQVVQRACPRAGALGVRPGLSLGQAHALVPGLVALADEPQRDRAALERLAGWALCFSPLVEPVAPDTLLVDVTGCERLFGGEENIARQALAGLAQRGFTARAALADTVGAAAALARAGGRPLVLVPRGQGSAYLAPLPPWALRIEPEAGARLEALGIRTIGDLLMLPRAVLPARFGSHLVLRVRQALGEVPEPVRPFRPVEYPAAQQRFELPVSDMPTVQAVAGRLLAEVLGQVRRRGAALRRLACVLYGERVPPRVLVLGLARASRTPEHVARLLAQRLEQVDLAPGVTGLMVVARELSPWHGGQGALFESRTPADGEALAELLDRLAGRLGYGAVLRPRLVDDHQPERACRLVSVAEAGCEPEEAAAGPLPAAARPVRLLPRPVPIRAIALLPDGPPTWLFCCGQEHVVVDARGPERLETAWWRGPDVRRDYFRVTSESGAQFWVFRGRPDGGWFLHGLFA